MIILMQLYPGVLMWQKETEHHFTWTLKFLMRYFVFAKYLLLISVLLGGVRVLTAVLLGVIISLAKEEISVRQSKDVWNVNVVKRSVTWKCKAFHTGCYFRYLVCSDFAVFTHICFNTTSIRAVEMYFRRR